jgi:ubiquitin carboxyl-terminal hydrolase 9/24
LTCTKIQDDWFPLLDLMAMVLKFQMYNSSRASESIPLGKSEDQLFVQPIDSRLPKGWLVDLINRFGQHGGFQKLHDRITSGTNLSIPLIYFLVRPFGMCYELLTPRTIKTIFLPIIEAVPKFLENLTDDELKKEAKNESRTTRSVQ